MTPPGKKPAAFVPPLAKQSSPPPQMGGPKGPSPMATPPIMKKTEPKPQEARLSVGK